MGHDGIVVIQIFFAPHRLKQFLGGNYASLMLAEIPENIELDGSQDNFLAVYAAVVGILVYMKPTDIFLRQFLLGQSRIVPCVAAQLGTYPGGEPRGLKGLVI